jgi:DNA repair protein RadC
MNRERSMWWRKDQARRPAPAGDWAPAERAAQHIGGFAEAMARAADRISDAQAGRPPLPLRPARAGAEPARVFPSEGPDGHRHRMRDRLLDRGPDSLADYELLEMLLFFAQPKGDTKRVAKRLINRFGSYANVLAASPQDLQGVDGVGRFSVAALKLVHASALRLSRGEVLDQPILNNWDQLMEYLNAAMARERVEQFRILFLDTKNRLIADEVQSRGTINQTPVYPREVAKRALDLHAASVILAHNHPSGDPTPSMADLDMTSQLQRLLKQLEVALHDHVIIGNGKWISLRQEGFL